MWVTGPSTRIPATPSTWSGEMRAPRNADAPRRSSRSAPRRSSAERVARSNAAPRRSEPSVVRSAMRASSRSACRHRVEARRTRCSRAIRRLIMSAWQSSNVTSVSRASDSTIPVSRQPANLTRVSEAPSATSPDRSQPLITTSVSLRPSARAPLNRRFSSADSRISIPPICASPSSGSGACSAAARTPSHRPSVSSSVRGGSSCSRLGMTGAAGGRGEFERRRSGGGPSVSVEGGAFRGGRRVAGTGPTGPRALPGRRSAALRCPTVDSPPRTVRCR